MGLPILRLEGENSVGIVVGSVNEMGSECAKFLKFSADLYQNEIVIHHTCIYFFVSFHVTLTCGELIQLKTNHTGIKLKELKQTKGLFS